MAVSDLLQDRSLNHIRADSVSRMIYKSLFSDEEILLTSRVIDNIMRWTTVTSLGHQIYAVDPDENAVLLDPYLLKFSLLGLQRSFIYIHYEDTDGKESDIFEEVDRVNQITDILLGIDFPLEFLKQSFTDQINSFDLSYRQPDVMDDILKVIY